MAAGGGCRGKVTGEGGSRARDATVSPWVPSSSRLAAPAGMAKGCSGIAALRVPLVQRLKWHRARQPKAWTAARAFSALVPLVAVEPPYTDSLRCFNVNSVMGVSHPPVARQCVRQCQAVRGHSLIHHPLFNTPSQDVAQLVLPRYVAQRDPNTWRRLIMHPRLVTQEHPENPPTHRTSPSEMWYFD